MPYVDDLVDCINLAEDPGFFSYECEKGRLEKIKHYSTFTSYKASFLSAMENIFLDIPTDCLNIITEYVSDFHQLNQLNSCKPFLDAVKKGHIEVADYLLSLGQNINDLNIHGESALYIAAREGHTEMVLFLLSKGAEDASDDTVDFFRIPVIPLHIAARNGHLSTVIALVETLKPDINRYYSHGYEFLSPLSYATLFGHIRIVRYLLSKGAQIITTSIYGTALLAAAENGSVRMMDMLYKEVDCPDLLNRTSFKNVSPIICAAYYNNIKMVEYLIEKKVSLLTRTASNMTAYSWACSNGNLVMMSMLEKAGGCDLHFTDWNGLFSAVAHKKYNAVRWILDLGASASQRASITGYTSLHIAVKEVDTKMIRLLLERGADVNIPSELGETPFHTAIIYRSIMSAQALLQYSKERIYMSSKRYRYQTVQSLCLSLMASANDQGEIDTYLNIFTLLKANGFITDRRVHACEKGNCSLIEIAVQYKLYDVFFMLIDEVHSINSFNKHTGLSLLHLACYTEAPVSVVEAIINKGADVNILAPYTPYTPLYYAIYSKNIDIILLLLKHNANPNLNVVGIPLLQHFVVQCQGLPYLYTIIDKMIQQGADVHAVSRDNATSLMAAVSTGNLPFTKYCILRGCDIQAEMWRGGTALTIAAEAGYLECVKVLIEAGANINHKTHEGKTAILLATEHNHFEIVNYLAKEMRILCSRFDWMQQTPLTS